MNSWLIGGIAVVYVIVAIEFYIKGNVGMALSFLGYALGNVGILIATI
jgi:hypothetical protein